MRTLCVLIVCFVLCNGCKEQSIELSLENGLKDYTKARIINEALVEGYYIERIAFYKKDSANYQFIFKLSENSENDSIEKYSLGLVIFPDKMLYTDSKEYEVVGFQSRIKEINHFKYIIEEYTVPIKRMDSLHVFLYDRDKYKGVLGDRMIRLKNIRL
jgi:hypothetical protein